MKGGNDDMILTNSQRRGLHGEAVILGYIKRTGHTIAGLPIWTSTELDFLRNLYPDRNATLMRIATPKPGRNRKQGPRNRTGDRKGVVSGQRVSDGVDSGGGGILKK